MSPHILVTVADGLQTIRIDRPLKRNALTDAMYEAMAAAFEEAHQNPEISVTLLVGAAGVFTAGNDMSEFQDYETGHPEGPGDDPSFRLLQLLATGDKPLVAAVDGLAVGVGTTMLLHFDLVFASPKARFKTPFLDLALVPEAASTLIMPRRMGYVRAFEMLCMGEWFDAERALAAGLINAVVPSEDLESRARTAAVNLAKKPQEALALARRLMRGDPTELLDRMAEEHRLIDERLRSVEAKEAFKAFFEKRPPDFAKLRSR